MQRILIIGLSMLFSCLKSQVTIYSDGYPKGLIVSDFEEGEKVYYPIENKQLKCLIHKSEVNFVLKGSDTIYKNKGFDKSDKVVMPIEPTTGKINFTEVVETKNNQKDMYSALKALPNSTSKYEFVSGSDDQSLVNYKGFFYVKFAGDLNTIEYSLNIKIKDNKIKYELTNFRMYFIEKKDNSMVGGKNYGTGATSVHDNPLERNYVESYRGDRFFREIDEKINGSISELKLFVAKPVKSDW